MGQRLFGQQLVNGSTVSHRLPVPKRRGLREDGAEDGGGAENDECAEAHGALPSLLVEMSTKVRYSRLLTPKKVR